VAKGRLLDGTETTVAKKGVFFPPSRENDDHVRVPLCQLLLPQRKYPRGLCGAYRQYDAANSSPPWWCPYVNGITPHSGIAAECTTTSLSSAHGLPQYARENETESRTMRTLSG
jgi:hypothetical protein